MAIDIIARGLATSLIGSDGKISSDKLPTMEAITDTSKFTPIGGLTDPSLIEGRTAEEILLTMLFGIVNPTFTNPSFSVSIDGETTAIAGKTTTISGSLIFDRGAIEPPYGTSGYRTGIAQSYEVNGISFDDSTFTIEFTPIVGDNTISAIVYYAEGEQPLNSIGQNYDKPYPAGSLVTTFNIKGINQIYTESGSELEFIWFEDTTDTEQGQGYQGVMVQETEDIKQSFAIAQSVKVIGIKQYEPMTQTWQWIGGSAEASLTYFDTTIIEGDSLDETDDYVLYTNNDYLTGERELRIYVE